MKILVYRRHRIVGCLLLVLCLASGGVLASPRVVVSIPPIHSLVQSIMTGVGQAELVYSGGQSPHNSSLTPSAIGLLHSAELVVWVGPGLEAGLQRAMAQLDEDKKITLLEMHDLPLLAVRTAGVFTEHSDHSEHAEHSDHDSGDVEEYDHGLIDPHLWLSPTLTKVIVASLADRLAQIDPQNEATYRNNAESLQMRIDSWQVKVTSVIEEIKNSQYMVFHDAYQYFEKEFGLQPVAAVSLNPERVAGARRLKLLRQQVEEEQIVCLFTEPQFEPDAARVIVEGTNSRLGILDPVGAGLKPGPLLWFELMDNLVDSFVTCMDNGH